MLAVVCRRLDVARMRPLDGSAEIVVLDRVEDEPARCPGAAGARLTNHRETRAGASHG